MIIVQNPHSFHEISLFHFISIDFSIAPILCKILKKIKNLRFKNNRFFNPSPTHFVLEEALLKTNTSW
jgi:hypothetical protein